MDYDSKNIIKEKPKIMIINVWLNSEYYYSAHCSLRKFLREPVSVNIGTLILKQWLNSASLHPHSVLVYLKSPYNLYINNLR